MTPVEFSAEAESDLTAIALFIAEDNPARAYSFVDELSEACRSLRDQPYRFALLPGFEDLGYRRRPYGRFSIIYVTRNDDVRIVRVLSAAMDLREALN